MGYNPKFIEGMSVIQLETEKETMYEEQYCQGLSICKTRLWDINFTLQVLTNRTSAQIIGY